MKEDLISVIVPVYNVEEYLDRCVESILNQTYTNLEIILIDDGSTDGSERKCDEWSKRDRRIIVIHKENGGLSDARNVGIERSKGDYIAFVDSDDYIRSDMYEILLNNLKDNDADVSAGMPTSFSKEEDLKNVQQSEIKISYYKENEVFQQLFNDKIGETVVVWNKLYSKKVFRDNLRFPKGKIHEEVFFAHRMLGNIQSIVYTTDKLYYYYKRQGSISNHFCIKRLDELDGMYDRMLYFKQKRFQDTIYPLLSFLAYYDKLIRFYGYFIFYNNDHEYDKNRKEIKQKFDAGYVQLMRMPIDRKKKVKYVFFKNFPDIFYYFVMRKKIK